MEMAVFDEQWQLLDRWREPTPVDDFDAFASVLNRMVSEADQRFEVRGSVGMGVPGVVKQDGSILSANIPCLNQPDGQALLADRIGRSLSIDKDSVCFTHSEMHAGGAAEGYQQVVGAILGTGAGAGIAIRGVVVNELMGEWGHLPLPAQLQSLYTLPLLTCGCGLTGCLEKYIAGPGLAGLYERQGVTGATTQRWVADLRNGKAEARRVFDIHQDILGSALANLVKLINPQVIVLGGGISLIDEVVAGIPAGIRKHYFPDTPLPLVRRATQGDSSGVRGAAMFGRQLADQ
ncbi:N-acetylgalactosamine kinase AgaK [Halomonadaceae bacterium LMG 33818]